jgi:hypothetical protein
MAESIAASTMVIGQQSSGGEKGGFSELRIFELRLHHRRHMYSYKFFV